LNEFSNRAVWPVDKSGTIFRERGPIRMNDVALVILSALLTGNTPVASQWKQAVAVEEEYQQVLAEDNGAMADVNRWIKENDAFRAAGGGLKQEELSAKIATRLQGVVSLYEDFLKQHPDHVEAHIAYGSFLNEVSEEEKAADQWERARLLDPKNPAAWNNLANHFGHFGPVTNAFAFYAKAIELSPYEPIYYQNLATTVYLFRRDAEAYYGIDEQHVFDKALELYHKALELSPGSFPVATDLAQTYYGIKPFRLKDAMAAWQEAFKYANDDDERQAVYIHFARLEIRAGHYSEASNHLDRVVLPQYEVLKKRLLRLMEERRTDAGPAGDGSKPPEAPDSP
jgi:tetratricopeptide (TPR) repeat protein